MQSFDLFQNFSNFNQMYYNYNTNNNNTNNNNNNTVATSSNNNNNNSTSTNNYMDQYFSSEDLYNSYNQEFQGVIKGSKKIQKSEKPKRTQNNTTIQDQIDLDELLYGNSHFQINTNFNQEHHSISQPLFQNSSAPQYEEPNPYQEKDFLDTNNNSFYNIEPKIEDKIDLIVQSNPIDYDNLFSDTQLQTNTSSNDDNNTNEAKRPERNLPGLVKNAVINDVTAFLQKPQGHHQYIQDFMASLEPKEQYEFKQFFVEYNREKYQHHRSIAKVFESLKETIGGRHVFRLIEIFLSAEGIHGYNYWMSQKRGQNGCKKYLKSNPTAKAKLLGKLQGASICFY